MTSLVDLAVRLDRLFFSPVETQHLSYLQDMPLLGLLHLTIQERFPPRSNPPSERKDIFLPELNFLCFTGHIAQLNVLMAYLAEAFRIDFPDTSHAPPLLLAPHLSKFLWKGSPSFSCAQINAAGEGIKLFMVTPTRPPFKFIVKAENSLEQLGHVFSVTLSRVKVVFFMPPFTPCSCHALRHITAGACFFRPSTFHKAETLGISF